jgi:hypothetical protein
MFNSPRTLHPDTKEINVFRVATLLIVGLVMSVSDSQHSQMVTSILLNATAELQSYLLTLDVYVLNFT